VKRLARWCFTHKFLVIAAWLVAIVGLNAIESSVGSAYKDNFKLPHTDSFDAVRLLQRNVPRQSGDTDKVVFSVKDGKVTDPATRARVEATLAKIAALPHVGAVQSPYTATGQISENGQIGYTNVTFDSGANKISSSEAKTFVKQVTNASGNGVEFEVGGQVAEAGNRNNSDSSLFIGFIAAGVVLFLVFGSFLAMLLPLITAGAALGTGIAVVGLLSHVFSMASFSSQLALLIGLGVGVDYALFIVTRYRQGRLRGLEPAEATVQSLDTSGRAVLFAGLIVCIAMLGMFALGISFLYGVAVASAIAVSFTVLSALTLLPAMLSVFGRLVLRRRERKALAAGEHTVTDESPAWARWTGWLRKRPALAASVTAAVLVIIAIPFFSIRLGSSDQGSDPSGTTTRKAYDLLAKAFGPGYNGPFQLVAQINSPSQQAAFVRVVRAAAQAPGIVGASAPRFLPGVNGTKPVALANVVPKGSPQDKSTTTTLHKLRNTVIPEAAAGSGLRVLVGGNTAIFEDFSKVLSAKLPLFIGIVVLLSFLLLMVVFRSLLIPLTAAVMNMLSAGAAFGIVTAVFQNGWGASLLGIDKTGPIEAFLPVLVFPIVFGLSMDYEVFLISRIYEEWHKRGDSDDAVAHGLAATGRTITAAAAIMVLVFGAFVLGGERVIELFGIGLASAVLLDALLVRSVLVPAVMLLFGDRNWYLPDWLSWLPKVNVEGSTAVTAHSSPAGAIDGSLPEPVS
jgi:putative drug exporter of the RND superfamily